MNLKAFLALLKNDDGYYCNMQGCYCSFTVKTKFIGDNYHKDRWLCDNHRKELEKILSKTYAFSWIANA